MAWRAATVAGDFTISEAQGREEGETAALGDRAAGRTLYSGFSQGLHRSDLSRTASSPVSRFRPQG